MTRALARRIVVASMVAFALALLAACSSGSDAPGAQDSAAPGGDVADAPDDPGADQDPDDVDAGDTVDETEPEQPTVLTVVDDVVVVPVFDTPNGAETPIYDVNVIDDIELEYPLLATTEFGNPLTLAVQSFDGSGEWARVLLPVRPNGSTGWVQTELFTSSTIPYRIAVDLADGRLEVYQGDALLRDADIAQGRPDRPTPAVSTYIDEIIDGASVGPAFGDWVLSLAAFSEQVGTFNGGLPKLAIAGTDDPSRIGEPVTSGIVQVPNDMITFLAETVPPGTPVDITG